MATDSANTEAGVIAVDPFRCRLWQLHDRLDESLTEQACSALIKSIARYGQHVPALGRPVTSDPDCDVELIYGARRWFAAQHLNRPLIVQLRPLSDRDALVAMDIENRNRKDISPYERGMSYARWLKRGHFGSQEEIARALQISAAQVCRLVKLARLPAVIVAAFNHSSEILESWGIELSDAWQDSHKRPLLARKARAVAQSAGTHSARRVYELLMASCQPAARARMSTRDEVVRGRDGTPVMRIRRLQRSVALLLPQSMSEATLRAVATTVADILSAAHIISDRAAGMDSPQARRHIEAELECRLEGRSR